MKHRKKHIWASIMILLIVAFDQVTKRLAESALMGGQDCYFAARCGAVALCPQYRDGL